jgi:hypothetical protein
MISTQNRLSSRGCKICYEHLLRLFGRLYTSRSGLPSSRGSRVGYRLVTIFSRWQSNTCKQFFWYKRNQKKQDLRTLMSTSLSEGGHMLFRSVLAAHNILDDDYRRDKEETGPDSQRSGAQCQPLQVARHRSRSQWPVSRTAPMYFASMLTSQTSTCSCCHAKPSKSGDYCDECKNWATCLEVDLDHVGLLAAPEVD